MRRRLRKFLPIVLMALAVQFFAPIMACWAVSIGTSNPLLGSSICRDDGGSTSNSTDPSGQPCAHDGCCAACSLPTPRRSTPPSRRPRGSICSPNVWYGVRSRRTGCNPEPARTPRPGRRRRFPDHISRAGAARAVPDDAVERAGRRASVRIFKCSVFMSGVAQAARALRRARRNSFNDRGADRYRTLPPVTVEAPHQLRRLARQESRDNEPPRRRGAASRWRPQQPTRRPRRAMGAVPMRRSGLRRSSSGFSCRRRPTASPPSRLTRRSISRTPKTPSNIFRACSSASATMATTRRCWRPEPGVSIQARGPDLLRRSADLGADRQQQFRRFAALEFDFAGAIARIDFLNGPFAAAYPGNSIGGVLLITSKMPDHAFAIVSKRCRHALESIRHQGHLRQHPDQRLRRQPQRRAFLVFSANYQDSYQQPLTYTTNGTIPAGTTGTFPALTKQGTPAMSSAPARWRIRCRPRRT